jgi:hypothetical protein
MRYIVPVLVCALAVSCVRSSYYDMDTWAKAYEPSATQSANSDDDIRESVFRYQMAHNKSIQREKAHAYYLSLEAWQDPSDEFMTRFARNLVPVKKLSACETSDRTPIGVYHKDTQLPGLVFAIRTLERTGDGEALVSGGYYESGKSGTGGTFHLKFRNGRWVVIESSESTNTEYFKERM